MHRTPCQPMQQKSSRQQEGPAGTRPHLGGLSGPQQVGKHSTTASKSGSTKNAMEYRSHDPVVTTLCTVDLKRSLVHLCSRIAQRGC